ncbi:shikimate kinase [Alicyclobacillus dauci]|uniref:Shikimate kinase n=1 Tax=Alicyclobacillus dauci TaxID=1475485 RepID=A0ABY6Z7W1_9BACL|nr:shikimate kinase [Alicyclobacillus dauci]WAH38985.1 shikimate kinase [Alicyclobacillus dauci]
MKDNLIALVGFMASGKSTVGAALASRLHRRFIDLDKYIEDIVQLPIPEIFQSQGEVGFRSIETRMLADVTATEQNIVLSTGGGIVTVEQNRALLSSAWRCVYLRAKPSTIQQRLEADGTPRPLLQSEDPSLRIRTLMADRTSWYEEVSDVTVDVDDLSVDDIADRIITLLHLV